MPSMAMRDFLFESSGTVMTASQAHTRSSPTHLSSTLGGTRKHGQVRDDRRSLNGDDETDNIELQPIRDVGANAFSEGRNGSSSVSLIQPSSQKRQIAVLISGFLTVLITVGMNQTYGVFLEFYVNVNSPHFDNFLPSSQASNKAMVAFVETLGAKLTWGGSILLTPSWPGQRISDSLLSLELS
jgi:hypothetical protein